MNCDSQNLTLKSEQSSGKNAKEQNLDVRMHFTHPVKTTQWNLYVSSQTNTKTSEDEMKLRFLFRKFFRLTKVNYSMTGTLGGYLYADGTYTQELSYTLIFVGADQQFVEELGCLLKNFFHQESVLITSSSVEQRYLINENAQEKINSNLTGKSRTTVDNQSGLMIAMLKRTRDEVIKKTTRYSIDRTLDDCSCKQGVSTLENIQKDEFSFSQYETTANYCIYIGLDQRQAELDFELKKEVAGAIIAVLGNHMAAYSLSIIYGGYGFDDGQFFEQDSLLISLIGAREDEIKAIAKAACKTAKQEVCMITKSDIQCSYLTTNPS